MLKKLSLILLSLILLSTTFVSKLMADGNVIKWSDAIPMEIFVTFDPNYPNGAGTIDGYFNTITKLSFSDTAPETYDYCCNVDEGGTGSIKLYLTGNEAIYVSNQTMILNNIAPISSFSAINDLEFSNLVSTSDLTSIESLYFPKASGDINIDLSFFDTSNVTTFSEFMSHAFNNPDSINLNLSNFVIRNGANLENFFDSCSFISGEDSDTTETYLNLTNWTIESDNEINLSYLFGTNSYKNPNLTINFSGFTSHNNVKNLLNGYGGSSPDPKIIIPNKTAVVKNDGSIEYMQNGENYKFYYNLTDYATIVNHVLSYGVKYHLNGGSYDDGLVEDDIFTDYILDENYAFDDQGKYNDLIIPSMDGKVFDGWHAEPSLQNKVTSISKDDYETNYVHLYAKFKDEEHHKDDDDDDKKKDAHVVLNTSVESNSINILNSLIN